MKKAVGIIVLLAGAALLITGLVWQLPGTHLTTYSLSDAKYSRIEEYVGGDAYNYIVGASLVSGFISGLITMKAVFIAAGALIMCISALYISHVFQGSKQKIATQQNAVLGSSMVSEEVPRVSFAPLTEKEMAQNPPEQTEAVK